MVNCENCTYLKASNGKTVIGCEKGHLTLSNSDCPRLFSYNDYKVHGTKKAWLQDSCVDYDPEEA